MAAELFPPALRKMLSTRMVQGRTRELALVGDSTENNLFIIANLLREHKPMRTLEIDLACGASALAFAHAHRNADDGVKRVHVAVDPFQADLDDAGLVQIENDGLSPYFQFIRGSSYAAHPKLLRDGESFGMIYIDGSHHLDHVFIDASYAARLLPVGGIVLFDDSAWPEVNKVIRFVRQNWKHAFSEIDLAPYRKGGGTDWRYRIARSLKRNQLTGFKKIDDPERSANSVLKKF